MRATYKLGQWNPDNAEHGGTDLLEAKNVYATASGYAPVKDFHEIAAKLTGDFRGGASFVASDGTARMLAGDSSDLYTLGGGVWSSAVGSLSVNGRWYFTQFGDDIVCTNGAAPQAYDLIADTAADLGGTPPDADLCCTVRDFVVLGRVNSNNQVIQWSGQGDCTNWAGTNGGGDQPIYTGGKIMGLVGGEYGLIIQRFSVKRMSFTGDLTSTWQIDEISTNYGCVAEGSVATAGRLTFFYSDRGFVRCDGTDVQPIGTERVDRTFRERYSTQDLDNMWSAIDPVRTLVIWAMPNALWLYNWTLDRWTTVELSVSAVFNSFSEAISIDALDAIYGDLDSIPYSLDDPRFAGGSPRLTIVAFDGRFGVLTGDNLAATVTTRFVELGDAQEARVRFVRPITDSNSVSLVVDSRKRLGDDAATETFTVMHASGDMPVRAAGRSLKFSLTIAAGAVWSYLADLTVEFSLGVRR